MRTQAVNPRRCSVVGEDADDVAAPRDSSRSRAREFVDYTLPQVGLGGAGTR